MALITLRGVTVGFGGPALLDGVDLQIEPGERLCLVGRNGSGKSTLMRVVGGELTPDEGEVNRTDGLRVARLAQEVPAAEGGSVYDVVAGGLGDLGGLLAEYHHLSREVASDTERLAELERVQHRLEASDGWQMGSRVEAVVTRLGLAADVSFSTLSGGLKRRVMLARALVGEPDLLLLDEPTNHLDIENITWLEEFLLGFSGSLLFITHDRAFLRRLATRIADLDRGRLTNWPGDYDTYLRRKAEALEAEATSQALFDKKLAEEEAWIRQGIKARRTRNEGRVRALKALREERRERRERVGSVRMEANRGELSGKLVIEALGVGFAYGERPVVRGLDTTILRGDRVGIIGPNGAGKTTLLRLLLGELAPQQGSVRLGAKLEVAYFDQQRAQLDTERSVRDNLAGGSDKVTINGQSRHVMSYLRDFLFPPERANTPVKALSGGERNRLLLARLFAQPSNLLVLDEPTNDLDVETLDLLEELLGDYDGTILLVSHDRDFLDRIVTGTLVFEGEGRVAEYVGGYSDWLRQRPAPEKAEPVEETGPAKAAPAKSASARAKTARPRKLGYREQRELEELPRRIEALEAEQQALHTRLADPAFYRDGGGEVATVQARLAEVEAELEDAFARWEALEGLAAG